jgi:hypothetical protein|eukprot:2247446-Prymnesium_polylepis.1
MLTVAQPLRPTLALILLCVPFVVWQQRQAAGHATSPASAREYDIVVFGATGTQGTWGAAALLGIHTYFKGTPEAVPIVSSTGRARIALAARNPTKLAALRDKFVEAGANMDSIHLLIADLNDRESLDKLVRSTKVLANFAGIGQWDPSTVESVMTKEVDEDDLIMRCARAGTHLVDATMFYSPGFTREGVDGPIIRTIDTAARASGAVVALTSGCTSVPHEMTTVAAVEALGSPPRAIRNYEVALYPGAKKELLLKDGTHLYPLSMLQKVRARRCDTTKCACGVDTCAMHRPERHTVDRSGASLCALIARCLVLPGSRWTWP